MDKNLTTRIHKLVIDEFGLMNTQKYEGDVEGMNCSVIEAKNKETGEEVKIKIVE